MNDTKNHRLCQSSTTIWCILKHNAVLFTNASHKIPIFRLHRRRHSGVSSTTFASAHYQNCILVLRSVLLYICDVNRNRIIPFIHSPSHVGWCACVCVDLSYVAVDCPCYEAKQLIRIFRVDYERIQSQCGHAHRELGKSKTVILGRRTV